MLVHDVLIVGGGIAGAALAYELSYSLNVVLLERASTPGRHATGSAAGIVTETLNDPLVRSLTSASRRFFDDLPGGFDRRILAPRPLLSIGTQAQREQIETYWRQARKDVPDVQLLLPHECEAVCPVLRPGQVSLGLLEPRAIQIDVLGLHTGFLHGTLARGGRMRTNARVTGMERHRDAWLVLCADGTVTAAKTVVLAAGAWADEVADLAGAEPAGLRSFARTQFVVSSPPGSSRDLPLVVDIAGRFYFRSSGTDLLCSPMDETELSPRQVPNADRDEIQRALRDLAATTTLDASMISTAWAGLRTFAPDRRPVVGFDPAVEGLFWFAGLGDYGLQVAPALARAGSALLRGTGVPTDLRERGIAVESLAPGRAVPQTA